ncbi:hypothetical protein PIB30_029319 [Stylosanthes scabra]|uniref:Uncharacterized protein n=1 Tax=Stylosanthes scabra TaxID=79078 RepID=A0ABU6ZAD9_9FABA|nr:hypothetical protein [Stylosanthes scabra]
MKIFENKTIDWSEAWEMINSAVKSRVIEKKNTDGKASLQGRTGENLVQAWWQCCLFNTVENKYFVGGYLIDILGEIIVFMGEEIATNSEGDAHLQGLECSLQFMLEELSERSENIRIFSSKKVFDEVRFEFKQEKDFKAKDQWEGLARNTTQRWIHWN